uniref:Multiple epidermal growth factor-like domains protein 10 n=1 Tax=Crassostrea virginica TaxID=6565 RepID=A0A8B8BHH2_CRAVI|nr:multiple epidermal growth factor-like domains protein 10 [Crassostrea virginica]
MFVKVTRSCLTATLLAIIWRRVHGDYNRSPQHNGSGNCGYNHFYNGNDCATCPLGTFGINCSSICSPSTYGESCSQKCNCSNSSCHHVYGCAGMSSALENTTKTTLFTDTTNTTQERKTERGTDKKDIKTITRYMYYIKILVILAGTVLSLTLLFLIAREIFKLFRMSETSGNYHYAMDAPVMNNTSGDITESLYNSRGTQE